MVYTVERVNNFSIIGFERIIHNETALTDCPAFWNECMNKYISPLEKRGIAKNSAQKAVIDNNIGEYGVCLCNSDNTFCYIIGGEYHGGEVPEGMTVFRFPYMTWLKFTVKGRLPYSLQSLNKELFTKFMPEHKQYEFAMGANVEWYSKGDMNSDDYECGIWIPVKMKACA